MYPVGVMVFRRLLVWLATVLECDLPIIEALVKGRPPCPYCDKRECSGFENHSHFRLLKRGSEKLKGLSIPPEIMVNEFWVAKKKFPHEWGYKHCNVEWEIHIGSESHRMDYHDNPNSRKRWFFAHAVERRACGFRRFTLRKRPIHELAWHPRENTNAKEQMASEMRLERPAIDGRTERSAPIVEGSWGRLLNPIFCEKLNSP
jgi:hypothetical protein